MATYRANMDDSLILKSEAECKNYYWLKLERHFYNKSTYETRVDVRMAPYMIHEFKDFIKTINMLELDTGEKLKAVIGYDTWKIVHDPTLIKDINDLKIQ